MQINFSTTSETAAALMQAEAVKQAVAELSMNAEVLARLRQTARLASTHYSTQIEGNRLTQQEAEPLCRP